LRHGAGTLAAATGANTKELMYRLGHASPQAALRYQHATRERDTAIAQAMWALIRAARPASPLPADRPVDDENRPAVTEDGRALGHAKVTPAVPARPRRAPQRRDQDFRVERATRSELAFSAWEVDLGQRRDLGKSANMQVRAHARLGVGLLCCALFRLRCGTDVARNLDARRLHFHDLRTWRTPGGGTGWRPRVPEAALLFQHTTKDSDVAFANALGVLIARPPATVRPLRPTATDS